MLKSQVYTLGKNGLEPVKIENLQLRQIVFLNGYGQNEYHHDRKAIYKIEETNWGNHYHVVNLDKFEFSVVQYPKNIKDLFGIGTYYKDGDFCTEEELVNAIQKTNELNVIRNAEKIVNDEIAKEKEQIRKTALIDLKENGIKDDLSNVRYYSELSTQEIKKLCLTHLKKVYPNIKFNCRTSYNNIDLYIMQTNIKMYVENTDEHCFNYRWINNAKNLTEEAKKAINYIVKLFDGFNYDKSDLMTDYFDVNFYFDLRIGKWDKPFIQL